MSDIIHVKRIASVSIFDLSPKFRTSLEIHDGYELVYVDSGTINCIIGNDEITIAQGEMLIHHPGEAHITVCNGKKRASIFTVIFECRSKAIKRLCDGTMAVPGHLLPLLCQLIDECQKTYIVSKYPLVRKDDAPIGGEQLVRNLTESFLIFLTRRTVDAPSMAERRQHKSECDLVSEIAEYLREHIHECVTLDELSEVFHFGKTHMCVSFKKRMGTSIINYHLDLKVDEAKRMLREEALTVHEIADKLGFDSPEYFSRCFLKRVGYSPRSFKNMLITCVKEKR